MTDPKTAIPMDLVIKLERTMCPAACPDYSLTIYGNGKIMYEGRLYVATKGKRQQRISCRRVRELLNEFHRIDYFSLRDRYDAVVSEGAMTKTSIQVGGKTKAVVNCHPSQAPG